MVDPVDGCTVSVDLAQAIMAQCPARHLGPAALDARVIALLVLIEAIEATESGEGRDGLGVSVSTVRDKLGVAQATASAIVEMARDGGLVEDVATHDHRLTVVTITAKGRGRRRGRGDL